jgi:hypothetical protein
MEGGREGYLLVGVTTAQEPRGYPTAQPPGLTSDGYLIGPDREKVAVQACSAKLRVCVKMECQQPALLIPSREVWLLGCSGCSFSTIWQDLSVRIY